MSGRLEVMQCAPSLVDPLTPRLPACLFGKPFRSDDALCTERQALLLAGPDIAPWPGPTVVTHQTDQLFLTMQRLDPLPSDDMRDWDPDLWAELGHILRSLYQVKVGHAGPLRKRNDISWHDFLRHHVTQRRDAVKKAEPKLASLVSDVTAGVLAALPLLHDPDHLTLVHRDIRPANLGRCEESGGLRLFDFEHCWGGDGLYDLATIWMDARLDSQTTSAQQARKALLTAYAPAFSQQHFDAVTCPIYALIRAIGAIAWGLRCADRGVLEIGLDGVSTWKDRLVT